MGEGRSFALALKAFSTPGLTLGLLLALLAG